VFRSMIARSRAKSGGGDMHTLLNGAGEGATSRHVTDARLWQRARGQFRTGASLCSAIIWWQAKTSDESKSYYQYATIRQWAVRASKTRNNTRNDADQLQHAMW